jgi:hypothetical protein
VTLSPDPLGFFALDVLIRNATIWVSCSTIRARGGARARFFGCSYAALGAMQAKGASPQSSANRRKTHVVIALVGESLHLGQYASIINATEKWEAK